MEQDIRPPKVLPPHYFLLALVGIGLLAWFAPALPHPLWLRGVGLLMIVAGVALAMTGSRLFARAGTNIIPLSRSSALVTGGVFRFSRNPMYLGMITTLAGAVLVLQTGWGWLVVAAFFVLIRQRFVRREEALLETTFGDVYTQYRGRVRRWL